MIKRKHEPLSELIGNEQSRALLALSTRPGFPRGPVNLTAVRSRMRCVVQKCAQASVTGGGRTASIGSGLCVRVGIHVDDGPTEV